MSTYEVLEKALELIRDEKNWCQVGFGWGGGPSCAVGALGRAMSLEEHRAVWRTPAFVALATVCPPASERSVLIFNDQHTHAEVVELFQKAIRAEKEKEGVPLDIEERVAA